MLFVSIIAAIGFGLILRKNMKYGLWILIALLPLYLVRFTVLFIPLTLLEVGILMLFIYWVYKTSAIQKWNIKQASIYFVSYIAGFRHKKHEKEYKNVFNLTYNKIRPLIYIFLLGATFGLLVSTDIRSALGIYKAYFIEPILFFIVFINIIKTKKDYLYTLYSLGLCVLIVSLYGVIQWVFGIDLWVELYHGIINMRITSFYPYPNAVGLLVAPVVGIFFVRILTALFKSKDIKDGLFSLLIILLGSWSIFKAESEGALVALAASGVIIGLLYNKITRYIVGIGLCIGIIGIVLTPTIHDTLIERATLRDFSGTIRRHTYKETLDMISDHAIFGAGIASYKEAMRQYHVDNVFVGDIMQPVEIFLYPHTLILNFWSEIGVIGLIGFLSLCLWFLIYAYKLYENEYILPLLSGMLVLLIHGLVDVPYFKNDLALLYWVLMGLMVVLVTLKHEKKDIKEV